jgi:steroid 5-alpha reductase family enzyme
MSRLEVLALVWLLSAATQLAGWRWQQRRRNAGIVDVLWSACLAASALVCAALGQGAAAPRVLLALGGGLWGLRLAGHLWRRVRAESEDGRYQALRARWGNGGARWLAFFQFQALLVAVFSIPFVIVANNPSTRAAWLVLGAFVWCGSVAGESSADRQLARFRADPTHRGLMLLFLRFLSGIPFTEAQALRTRGEDYRDYQRRTSMLIPWPPGDGAR